MTAQARAFIDTGSSTSFITEMLAKILHLPKTR